MKTVLSGKQLEVIYQGKEADERRKGEVCSRDTEKHNETKKSS